ncbi:MAG: hypothetical protein AAF572_07450 [Cyanobacteria bacterium P01_B01_bin.77]
MVTVSQYARHSRLSGSTELTDIWAARYFTKNSRLSTDEVAFSTCPLDYATSPTGRRKTVEQLNRHIQHICILAAIRTKELYTGYEILELKETAKLSRFAAQIYPVLLKFYQTTTPITITVCQPKQPNVRNKALDIFGIPEMDTLINILDPYLEVFKAPQDSPTDWQKRSFLTTQISISNELFLDSLNSVEQVLLKPYFDFLEEYVGIPWRRLCIAAENHSCTSSTFTLVEKMLLKIPEISIAVYRKWCQQFSHYYGRRGRLDHPSVVNSALRDFDMFQVYLWICMLEGNLDAIEQELLLLCTLVYQGIGIPWEMTIQGVELLVVEISKHLDSNEKAQAFPYAQQMLIAFSKPNL